MKNSSTMPQRIAASACFSVATLIVGFARASPPDEVLVTTPLVVMTRQDYEAELARLAPAMRGGFSTSPKRVTDLLNAILVNKTLAAQALREGLDKDPDVQQQIASETTRILARRRLHEIDEQAGREFDAKGDLTTAARERYLVEAEKFRRPEEISVSHILFETSKHGDDEARKLALDARAKVLAGADFNALAAQVSEDPSARSNAGRLGYFSAKGKMDPAFSKAAFALAREGDVSEPVKTQFGWHLIRLDGRKPAGTLSFEEAKAEILAAMRQQYIQDQQAAAVAAIRNDPQIKVNQPALDSLSTPLSPSSEPPNAKAR